MYKMSNLVIREVKGLKSPVCGRQNARAFEGVVQHISSDNLSEGDEQWTGRVVIGDPGKGTG